MGRISSGIVCGKSTISLPLLLHNKQKYAFTNRASLAGCEIVELLEIFDLFKLEMDNKEMKSLVNCRQASAFCLN
jgi:hypothetical protein